MAHANKTYVRNTNAPRVGANSQYADGSLSANAPLTVLGSLTHGSEITIITDGTYNFGSVSPDLLMYTDLKNATAAGTDFVPVEGVSVKTGYIGTAPTYYKGGGTYKVPLRTVAGMINSGNKAMAFGDRRTVLACPAGGTAGGVSDFTNFPGQFDSLYVVSRKQSTQLYFMGYFIWPAAEQENQMKNSVKNSQCKFCWHYATTDGANGGNILGLGPSSVANAYIGLPSGSGGGTVPLCAYVINSSTSVSVTISSNSISHFLQDTPSSDSARTVYLSNLSSVGNVGSAVVSSVVGNVVTLTVSGWPATGAGTLSILKLGEMQVLNRAIRQNEASIIVDSNTQYHLTRNGTAPDPFTIDPQHQIDTMYIHECWISLGTVTNKVYTRIIVPATGEIYNYTEEHDVASTMILNYFDRMVIPGNIQGMNADPITGNPNSSVGACAYVGDVHQNYGSNSAACRVQLVDTSDNGPTTKKLANWPHKLWSPYMIKCTYMEGMFAGSSPSGNYVQIIGASNTKIAGKQV